MSLTYELNDAGYTILNNGVPWIIQTDYIPYPAETIAESAQLHIDELMQQTSNVTPPVDEIAELKQANLLLTEEVAKLKLEIMAMKAGAQ